MLQRKHIMSHTVIRVVLKPVLGTLNPLRTAYYLEGLCPLSSQYMDVTCQGCIQAFNYTYPTWLHRLSLVVDTLPMYWLDVCIKALCAPYRINVWLKLSTFISADLKRMVSCNGGLVNIGCIFKATKKWFVITARITNIASRYK